jgi:hypothetical protein
MGQAPSTQQQAIIEQVIKSLSKVGNQVGNVIKAANDSDTGGTSGPAFIQSIAALSHGVANGVEDVVDASGNKQAISVVLTSKNVLDQATDVLTSAAT